MRIEKSNLLNDGKMFNDGRSIDLIQIEDENDFDSLLENIINSGYYDSSYFDSHIDYQEGMVKFDSFHLSSIIKFLKPNSVLELGCGRGDVLFLLSLSIRGNVRGIDSSQEVLKRVWPLLTNKVDLGDVFDVCRKYHTQKTTFDTFCAFDFWEHLHPKKLHDYIDSIVALAEEDALFFFNIPAFGEDRVFGEIFPLELEENREKFEQRLPFAYLHAESIVPPIPASGHLIWSHTEWWQKQFEDHGLVRSEELERNIHHYFDEHLFYARKSFYVFYRDSQKAHHRVKRLLRNGLTLYNKWKLLVEQQEFIQRFEKGKGRSFIDLGELKSTINHVEYYMVLDMEKRIGRLTKVFSWPKKIGALLKPLLLLLDRGVQLIWLNGDSTSGHLEKRYKIKELLEVTHNKR